MFPSKPPSKQRRDTKRSENFREQQGLKFMQELKSQLDLDLFCNFTPSNSAPSNNNKDVEREEFISKPQAVFGYFDIIEPTNEIANIEVVSSLVRPSPTEVIINDEIIIKYDEPECGSCGQYRCVCDEIVAIHIDPEDPVNQEHPFWFKESVSDFPEITKSSDEDTPLLNVECADQSGSYSVLSENADIASGTHLTHDPENKMVRIHADFDNQTKFGDAEVTITDKIKRILVIDSNKVFKERTFDFKIYGNHYIVDLRLKNRRPSNFYDKILDANEHYASLFIENSQPVLMSRILEHVLPYLSCKQQANLFGNYPKLLQDSLVMFGMTLTCCGKSNCCNNLINLLKGFKIYQFLFGLSIDKRYDRGKFIVKDYRFVYNMVSNTRAFMYEF